MRITFLGGAEEIGASCAVVDLNDDVRILVDCGQRLGASAGQELPDLSILESGPKPTAILLTHAHLDHVGGLPALEGILPADCPIWATAPTVDLARVMLHDAIRTHALHRQGDGQLPLYPAAAVQRTLKRFRVVRWQQVLKLSNELKATWYPSGHILGAGMIELRSNNHCVLFSGDLSLADQASIPGAFVPAIQPDMLILESTYGSRLHTHRPLQEQRLLTRIQTALHAGGSVLFPSFALGRAQEILALLGRGMRAGDMPRVPVWSDGMVRDISAVYSRHPDDLSPSCRRLWEQGLDPLFPDDLPIRPVLDTHQRQQIAASSEPCVVVASGGMLQGGAAQFYARSWIGSPQHLIALTGYQDEESPGQALLNLASAPNDQPRYFKLAGILSEVRCQFEHYSLSAHADSGELLTIVSKLKPRQVHLVHGDPEARATLAERLHDLAGVNVVLPRQGDSFKVTSTPAKSSGRASPTRSNPLAMWPPWDPYTPRELDLAELHGWLCTLRPRMKWVTVEELATLWKSPAPTVAADCDAVRDAIARQTVPYFVPETKRPLLLNLTPPENLYPPVVRQGAEQTLALARDLFPEDTGLLRVGFFPDEKRLQLVFRFPHAIEQNLAERLQELTRRSGWQWELAGQPGQQDLQAVLREWCGADSVANMSVDHATREVTATLRQPLAVWQADLAERFGRRTGYRLELEAPPAVTTADD